MDADGYPDESELDIIRSWPMEEGFNALFDYVSSLWSYQERWRREGQVIKVSTGEWSGNEDLIAALRENVTAWSICWQETVRGGHFVFIIPAFDTEGKRIPCPYPWITQRLPVRADGLSVMFKREDYEHFSGSFWTWDGKTVSTDVFELPPGRVTETGQLFTGYWRSGRDVEAWIPINAPEPPDITE